MDIYFAAALLPETTWEVIKERNGIPPELRQTYFVGLPQLVIYCVPSGKRYGEKKKRIYCTFMVHMPDIGKGF